MKKLITLICILQSVTMLAQKEYKYCELVGWSKFLSTKVFVSVDSGQGFNYSVIRDTVDSPTEYRNEKFYIDTKATTFEGKTVQTDAKGAYIWKKVEANAGETKVKKKVFNSMVEGMNYMGKQGWEFVQAYVVTSEYQNVYRWVLKKEK